MRAGDRLGDDRGVGKVPKDGGVCELQIMRREPRKYLKVFPGGLTKYVREILTQRPMAG